MPNRTRLSIEQASRATGYSVNTLNSYRSAGRGPKFRKDGREVYYLADEVEKYMEAKHKKRSK